MTSRRGTHIEYTPTPEAIRAGCLEAQKSWSKSERAKRSASFAAVPWLPPTVSVLRTEQRGLLTGVGTFYTDEGQHK